MVPRLRFRPLAHRDLAECLTFLPPALGLDESLIRALPRMWERLVDEPSVLTGVIEDLAQPSGGRIQAWGVTMILPRQLVNAIGLNGEPDAFVSRRVYTALNDGSFTPMTEREIGEANSRGDLTMLILHFSMRGGAISGAYLHKLIAMANDTFRAFHNGYNLSAIYYETGATSESIAVASGFGRVFYRNESSLDALPSELRPVLYGLTRKVAESQMPGPPARNAFEHQPPLFNFSASQRRLLRLALFDESDEALMPLLDVSVHGLKKLWRGIYERVEDRMPEFFGDDTGGDDGKRGPEKRRQVLAYVRQRPEELRPWAIERE